MFNTLRSSSSQIVLLSLVPVQFGKSMMKGNLIKTLTYKDGEVG